MSTINARDIEPATEASQMIAFLRVGFNFSKTVNSAEMTSYGTSSTTSVRTGVEMVSYYVSRPSSKGVYSACGKRVGTNEAEMAPLISATSRRPNGCYLFIHDNDSGSLHDFQNLHFTLHS